MKGYTYEPMRWHTGPKHCQDGARLGLFSACVPLPAAYFGKGGKLVRQLQKLKMTPCGGCRSGLASSLAAVLVVEDKMLNGSLIIFIIPVAGLCAHAVAAGLETYQLESVQA